MLFCGPSCASHVSPERELGTATEIENENGSSFLGLAIADGQFRHCSAATIRQRRMWVYCPRRTKARDHRGTGLGGPETASERNRHGDGAQRFDTGID